MKSKLLAMLLIAAMFLPPALGYWHVPTEPQCPHFSVLINNKNTVTIGQPYIFNETTDGFCENFFVTVWAVNVTDLFGYEFKLSWDETYFNLVSYDIGATWGANQVVIKPDATYDLSSPYNQVVVAISPAVGVNGDFLLANMTFHIRNDVCWLQGLIGGYFHLYDEKMSNSCTGDILTCTSTDGWWQFQPKQPKVYISPTPVNCSKVGTTFEITVYLKDIVKMTDFHICLGWNGYLVHNPCSGDYYTSLLYTKKSNVVINNDVFPTDWRASSSISVTSPACGQYSTLAAASGSLCVDVVMNSSFPLINGTIWLFKVTFTQCDPWYCGAQPTYTPIDTVSHTVTMENASTCICFNDGYISVKCPSPAIMYVGNDVLYANGCYTFYPIPGDLDGSGHTGPEDLMIEALFYGLGGCAKPAGVSGNAFAYFYDLNKDGIVDIFDLVLVGKNFCRDTP
jgi:hypothetical protein